MELAGIDDDDTEGFLSRLTKAQKEIGNIKQWTRLRARHRKANATSTAATHTRLSNLSLPIISVSLGNHPPKTATTADEDDCMAMWSMFGVDDLELDVAPTRQAVRPEPALSADMSMHSKSAALGAPLSDLGDHTKPVDSPAVVAPIASPSPGATTAAPPLQFLAVPAMTQSTPAQHPGIQEPLTSPAAERPGNGILLLAERSEDARLGGRSSCPVAGAAVGHSADTEGRMLEVEPGSVDIHNDSPPRVTKEQPANLQTKGDNDKTQGQERHQVQQQQEPQGKNPEVSKQPAQPGRQRVGSQNSLEAHHPEGMPSEVRGSGNISQHILNSPAEVSHQGNHQRQGTSGDPCGAPQHKTESGIRRVDLHSETSNSKRSPPDDPRSEGENETAEQQTHTQAEKGAQMLRRGTIAGQPQGNANAPGEQGNKPACQGGTGKQDSAPIVEPTAQAASCEQRYVQVPGLKTLTSAPDCPQSGAMSSPARDQKRTAAAGSAALMLVGAPHNSSGLNERQTSVNKARAPQLQPMSVSPPQDALSFQGHPPDQRTDQRPPTRQLQNPLDNPLPAKPMPQSSIPADPSVAQKTQARAARCSDAHLPGTKAPADAAEARGGSGGVAGKTPSAGLPPQAAAAPQQRRNCSTDQPSSLAVAAPETRPKKRLAAEPPALPFSLSMQHPPRKRANAPALDMANAAPVKLAKLPATHGRTPGSPSWFKPRASNAKCQSGADAGGNGTASSPAAPSHIPSRAAVNPATNNQLLPPENPAAGASKAAAAAPESKGRQHPQVQLPPQLPRRSVGAATKSRFAVAAGDGTGPLAGVAQGPSVGPIDNSAVFTEDYKALMRSARQELCKAEEYARLVQGIDARIDKMRLDLEAMHLQALELRVQAAIAGNRLVRLDNPVIAAKMASLHESLLEMLLEP